MKKHLKPLIVVVCGCLLLFKTPFIINRTDSLQKWEKRFYLIEIGKHDPPGFIFIEDKERLKDEFVDFMKEQQTNLLFGIGGESLNITRSDRLAWRDEKTLYLTNISPLLGLSDDFEFNRWEEGILSYWSDSRTSEDLAILHLPRCILIK